LPKVQKNFVENKKGRLESRPFCYNFNFFNF